MNVLRGFRWISLIIVIVLLFGFVTAQEEEDATAAPEVEAEAAAAPGKGEEINYTATKAPETHNSIRRRCLVYAATSAVPLRKCPAGKRRDSHGLCRVPFNLEVEAADHAAEVIDTATEAAETYPTGTLCLIYAPLECPDGQRRDLAGHCRVVL